MGHIMDVLGPRPDAATSTLRDPKKWLLDSLNVRATSAGEDVNPASALTLSAYFACLRNISEDLGKLEEKLIAWRVHYERRELEAMRERDKRESHPRGGLDYGKLAAHYRGAGQGLNEALEMLRGNQEIAQWPSNHEQDGG